MRGVVRFMVTFPASSQGAAEAVIVELNELLSSSRLHSRLPRSARRFPIATIDDDEDGGSMLVVTVDAVGSDDCCSQRDEQRWKQAAMLQSTTISQMPKHTSKVSYHTMIRCTSSTMRLDMPTFLLAFLSPLRIV